MRRPVDLGAVVRALIEPRLIHHTVPDKRTGQSSVLTVTHPSLIDLLENGLGTFGRGTGGGTGGMPGAIDVGALETWGQIRDQVRAWLRQLRVPWSDDLKDDLRLWREHWEIAIAQGVVRAEWVEDVERTVESWQVRIEQKYDPDERREWTEACPAVQHSNSITGIATRCGARRIVFDGTVQFAITLNVSLLLAECRACGSRWEGERGLMHLRYETNLADAERVVVAAATAAAKQELALTGPIDLP